MSVAAFATKRLKEQFWPAVAARIAARELTVEWLADALRQLAAEDGYTTEDIDTPEFKTFLAGKLGMM